MNKELETKKIAEIAYEKRAVFAYLVREIYEKAKQDAKKELEAERKDEVSVRDYLATGNLEEIANKLKNDYPDVYETIQKQGQQEETVEQFFENNSTSEIVETIKDKYPSVYDCIDEQVTEYVLNNLNEYDLDDSVKEDIAQEYIDDNTEEVMRDCFSSLSDYSQRDFLKDCIDEL